MSKEKPKKLELKLKKTVINSCLVGFLSGFMGGSMHHCLSNFMNYGEKDIMDLITSEVGMGISVGVTLVGVIYGVGHQIYSFYHPSKEEEKWKNY